MKLNKNRVYSLGDLTSEEKQQLLEKLIDLDASWNGELPKEELFTSNFLYFSDDYEVKGEWLVSEEMYYTNKEIVNAKELFYTLENIQVDCRELSEEQIKEMADIFDKDGYDNSKIGLEVKDIYFILRQRWDKDDRNFGVLGDHKDGRFTTITYEKFMELFSENADVVSSDSPYIPMGIPTNYEVKYIAEQPNEDEQLQPHYDNTNGSIYKFCNDQKLNSWEFDIIKRVVRCRKKGLFKEDLQKTKDLIDLYLKEFEDEK